MKFPIENSHSTSFFAIKSLTLISFVLTAFLIAWTPYSIFALSEQFGDPDLITPSLAVLPALIAKSSICYNPMIYVGMNSQVGYFTIFFSDRLFYNPSLSFARHGGGCAGRKLLRGMSTRLQLTKFLTAVAVELLLSARSQTSRRRKNDLKKSTLSWRTWMTTKYRPPMRRSRTRM